MKIYKIRERMRKFGISIMIQENKFQWRKKSFEKNKSNNLTLKLEGRNHRKKYSALINYNEGPKN